MFQDLQDWSDWFMDSRTLPTTAARGEASSAEVLIGLGSNAVAGYSDYAPGQLQGARFESGLDNSPMYDCVKQGDTYGDMHGDAHGRVGRGGRLREERGAHGAATDDEGPVSGEPTCEDLFNVSVRPYCNSSYCTLFTGTSFCSLCITPYF